MKKLIIGLMAGLLIGVGGSALLGEDTNLDLNASLNSGGLTIDKGQSFDGFPQGQGNGVSALPAHYIDK